MCWKIISSFRYKEIRSETGFSEKGPLFVCSFSPDSSRGTLEIKRPQILNACVNVT